MELTQIENESNDNKMWREIRNKKDMPVMQEEIIFYDPRSKRIRWGKAMEDGVHSDGETFPCSFWIRIMDLEKQLKTEWRQ